MTTATTSDRNETKGKSMASLFEHPEINEAIRDFFPSDPGTHGALLSDPILGLLRKDATLHDWAKALAGGEEEFCLRVLRSPKGECRLIGVLAKKDDGSWAFCLGLQRMTEALGSGKWQGISPATAKKVIAISE